MLFNDYEVGDFFDEMFGEANQPRASARTLVNNIESLAPGEFFNRQRAAERALLQMGITFNVYGERAGAEKIFPFDLVPRIVPAAEWSRIERGLKQRIVALNLFIDDLYHDQKILKDGIVPAEIVLSSRAFRKQCMGFNPPRGIWCHVTGTDLVRHRDGQIYVLEDNLRCPSGVSYVLENRAVMKSMFPQVFAQSRIRPVANYPSRLRDMLEFLAPDCVTAPRCVLLTPGTHNSAYFEHSFLAQQMGVELVEGRDLVVDEGYVCMRTTKGLEQVDVIYRRIDDDFLDPKHFRPDSMLGVPGLMDVYQRGNVALANAPGGGVADDKVVYAYVPRIVKYYLGEDIILPNVPTYICSEEADLNYVLDHLELLVVKAANESGGYGMLVGPHSTAAQRAEFADKIRANPRNYIAQPTLALSRVPTLTGDHFEGRHVDLRPYILYGKEIFVLPGGLTRVALKKGSLVVNSSQGGGSKDTWVLADAPVPEKDEFSPGSPSLNALGAA
ncbi:MAG: circularly permuted type 2 ATP-grasp protein [Verrucomicrobia bacterium]|nr:circularly permuted type 2 ATP-grasp protein [Verrucomicrobiota bacterium]MBI3868907.1 circularly permuted type 2 ATP-grasp protein [Verrucomicrobiota bacterium]